MSNSSAKQKGSASLKEKYFKEIAPKIKETQGFKNLLAVPRAQKVVVNMGIGKVKTNQKLVEEAVETLKRITGQTPLRVKSKKSISAFNLKKGEVVGLKVTLRGERMYHFLAKLISIVLPRVRDFRGVSNESFDGRGNYSLGFKDMTVFPEIEFSKSSLGGLEVTINTTAKNPQQTKGLLELLGVPFKKEAEKV